MSISFGSGLITVSVRWTAFKALAVTKSFSVQYVEDADFYTVFGVESHVAYTCNIWKQNFPQPDPPDYSSGQNAADLADFETNAKPYANRPLSSLLPDGRQRTSSEKTALTRDTRYSHDWTDPTTWYGAAGYSAAEAATDSGDHTVYTLAHQNVIDTFHGKLTGEDYLLDGSGRSFRVAVSVNGSAKAEQDPHLGSGGDFTVDYAAGSIHFLAANQPGDTVSVTYHYANGSTFVIAPQPGQKLVLDSVECQFSADVVFNDSVIFQPYGLVDVFAPQLMPGVPSGTKIPLGPPLVYKSIGDFQNDSNKAYPVYPAMGGSGWRGCPQPMVILDWDYVTRTELREDWGMEVRLSLQHDAPFGGFYATATFYCTTEPLAEQI